MVPARLNNPRYFFVLGLAQYANGLTEEAYTSFSEAARLGVDPKLALYWLGLTQRPSSSFIPDSWIKVDLSRFLRDLAKHNADKHFLADAVEQYKVALALSSAAQRPQKERAAWYAELASVYEALQNHAAAEAAYKNALLLDEQEAFRYNLARVLIEEKEDEAAQAELQRIQGEITHSPPYWVLLSQVQTELDNYSAAEASLIHATQLGAVRDRAWAHSVLATFYLQQGRLTDALQSQRVAVTLDPEYVWWRLHLGALYRQASDLDRADEQFKSALRLAADAASIAEAHLELGKLQLQRNQPGEAKQHFKVVLNMGLDSGDIRVMQATQLLLELDRQP
jgi:tetratricopeptide (TPR) repeat protein